MLFLLAASCTSGTEGIFASIEREQKVVALGGLSSTASVTSMAELSGQYFATGGKALFARSTATGTTKWTNATVGRNTQVVAVGTAGGKLFAIAGGVLYRAVDASVAVTDLVWNAVDLGSGDTAENLVPVRQGDGVTSNELIVVSNTSGVHNNIYRLEGTSGALSAAIVLPVVAPFGVQSAIFDGTNYYLLSETSITRMTSSLVATEVLKSNVYGHDFAGILYLNGTSAVGNHAGYYLTTMSNASVGGGLYKATTMPSFSALTTSIQISSNPASLGTMLYNKDNDHVWIGTVAANAVTEGRGYVEIVLSSDTLSTVPFTGSNNYTSTVLPTSAVGLLFRSSTGLYFLGTIANGLWTWNSTGTATTSTWSQQ